MAGSLELRASALRVRKMLLQKMPDDLKRAFADVSEKNGQTLSRAIARAAPVSEDNDPGALRRSVRYEVSEEGQKVKVIAGGGDVSYAIHAEQGTRRARAQPFFWPIYRLFKKRLVGGYGRALTKIVKKYSA